MDNPGYGELSPLDAMLWLMRAKWAANDPEGAVGIAKLAAPYVHVRASAAPAAARPPISMLSDEELAAELAAWRDGANSSGDDDA